MRLIFMGTPDFARPTLRALHEAGHEIAAVYTRELKPAGRGMALQETPVALLARDYGAPVETPKSLRNEAAVATFRSYGAEAAVVVAYGLILPKAILDAVPHGCFNLHASLLPRWRGAAPINRAIMAGDRETGVMTMRMEEGLDTGPVAMTARVAIGDDETAGELHDRLAARGGPLMAETIAALARGALTWTPQAEAGVTYATKIDKAESRIDWRRPAHDVHNHIRGLSPFPGAWCEAPDGARLKLLRTTRAKGPIDTRAAPGTVLDDRLTIACGDGTVRVLDLQRSGKGAMKAEEFLRGSPIRAGALLK
jgi:methionyl-tRNA formyltransferase